MNLMILEKGRQVKLIKELFVFLFSGGGGFLRICFVVVVFFVVVFFW